METEKVAILWLRLPRWPQPQLSHRLGSRSRDVARAAEERLAAGCHHRLRN